ncbi:uncharacterized protein BX663DRAFT_488018 [Cokeromyces recurvatus]|uniref:uncharacterized protein n=1 Tax=Cokeromyces recurvatus TaxID=90255 RepID=UPI00221FF333|nr:uncharacterized protein BX663DRAFT_488018 [Cokeromyces recurvatus]KAI7901058.1 hypothetical protein BX663DRAFT_488018 [Cokeromyces recurvatus]
MIIDFERAAETKVAEMEEAVETITVQMEELTLKNATKYTRERDSPRIIELRNKIVSEWKHVSFHSQMMRSKAWSRKGVSATVKVPTQKGVNISIIGCIASFGIVNFSKVDHIKKIDAEIIEREFHSKEENKGKKRKSSSQKEVKPKPKKGTTAYHIVKFVEAAMYILDRLDR